MTTGGGPSSARSASGNLSFERALAALNAAIAVGLAFHLVRELLSPWAMVTSDFTVFRTGWSLILRGDAARLYDASAQDAVQHALLREVGSEGFHPAMMAFLHPPHAALAGCLMGLVAERLGTPVAFRIWTLGSIALLAHLVRLIRDQLGGGPRVTALVTVTVAGFYPVLVGLQEGQVSALLAVAALACVVAIQQRRALAAACWLLALSIKPQILPTLLVVLIARRERRVLGLAAALGAGAALVTTLFLGVRVWKEYVINLPALERFFGVGTPAYMPTVRGVLTRLLDAAPEHGETISLLTLLAWLSAVLGVWAVASRTRLASDSRAPLALALAVGALASPHLFAQDLILWAAPVTLVLSLSREEGEDVWRRRARIVLCWPLWFVMARALDIRDTPQPHLPIDLVILPLAIATVWAAREASRAGSMGAGQTSPY